MSTRPRHTSLTATALLVTTALFSLGFEQCYTPVEGAPFFQFLSPRPLQLSETGTLQIELRVPAFGTLSNLAITLAPEGGAASPVPFTMQGAGLAAASIDIATPGVYRVEATAEHDTGFVENLAAGADFEIVALLDSAKCDVLNNAFCMIPYPTMHYFAADATSPTGIRLSVNASMLPAVNGPPLDPAPYARIDGASPTTSILMHFPGGVDVALSNAPRLLDVGATPVAPPYVDIRTTNGRSLDSDSPTLLIRASTGERILHFVEPDARAAGDPDNQLLIMRPEESLIPGERYIVAVRSLVHPDGSPIEAEATFRALRDVQPTTIDSLEGRRNRFNTEIFGPLLSAGVPRGGLILAFDFTTQSEEGLTSDMLAMRDEAFQWLEDQVGLGNQTFAVGSVEEFDCSVAGQQVFRIVRGTYQVPLYLENDPELDVRVVSWLSRDEDGDPLVNGVTNPPFTISLPCAVTEAEATPVYPILIGHGLFGDGEGMITGLAQGFDFETKYIAGATNWRGLSNSPDPQGEGDLNHILFELVGVGTSQLNNIGSLPDRLRQGQLNTLLLARMMKTGAFNVDAAFQPSPGEVAFPGEETEMFYYGISLGGIMGTMFAALSPDVERLHIDVPAMNFAFLLQRSTQFGLFEIPLSSIGLTNPAEVLLGLQLIHELWVAGEPAGYARHITGLVEPPLPGTNAKKMLMTVAWLDKQVSNQAQEVLARTLAIPNLDSSIQQGLQGIPDLAGPQDSALVIYDTGSFDLWDPAHLVHIPELANEIPTSKCDPHGARLTIPAALEQMEAFLQPGGQVENFCVGLCDADSAFERPNGNVAVCDPAT